MRFLFATTNIAAHAAGPLPVVRALVERGHEVRWYAGEAYAEQVLRVGAERVPLTAARDISGSNPLHAFPELAPLEGLPQVRRAFELMFVGLAPGQVSDLRAALERSPADLMVSDPLHFSTALVHELGGPAFATVSDSMLAVRSRDTAPFGPGLTPLRGPLNRPRNAVLGVVQRRVLFRSTQAVYERVRREVGLGPARAHVMDSIGSPYLVIHPGVPAFEYPRSDLPSSVRFVGAFRRGVAGDWQPPSWWGDLDGRTVVHVTQGTVNNDPADLILPAIAALAAEDVLVVVTTGGLTAEALAEAYGRRLPANVCVAPFIPYEALLERASVLVTNGGYTGVSLALAHGVPLVQAGVTEEKKEVAARIRWAHVGITLGGGRPAPDRVRSAVHRVLAEPDFRAAARRVQQETTEHDSVGEAADLLEELARARLGSESVPR